MNNSTQSFIALMLGCVGLLVIAGLDAFVFGKFGIYFDEGMIVVFAGGCGIHWAWAPQLPLGQPKQ